MFGSMFVSMPVFMSLSVSMSLSSDADPVELLYGSGSKEKLLIKIDFSKFCGK